MLKVSFLVAAKFDTLVVNGINQACHGAHAFPAEISSSIDDRIHRAEQVAVPGFFQSRPVTLNGVVFAVIGWVVNQSHAQPCQIGKLCHAQKKLAAPSIAFRPIVQIDDQQLDPWQFWLSVLPPQK